MQLEKESENLLSNVAANYRIASWHDKRAIILTWDVDMRNIFICDQLSKYGIIQSKELGKHQTAQCALSHVLAKKSVDKILKQIRQDTTKAQPRHFWLAATSLII